MYIWYIIVKIKNPNLNNIYSVIKYMYAVYHFNLFRMLDGGIKSLVYCNFPKLFKVTCKLCISAFSFPVDIKDT